jgi:alkyldihydroxyacetonephosphate synthase
MNPPEIDGISLVVKTDVDVSLSKLEDTLNREGFTLGYRPQKSGALTLRQALEERIPNRDALLYGEVEDICVAVEAIRKSETIVTKNVPRAATGPDFKKIFIGSGERYANLKKAVLKIHPKPEAREEVRIEWTTQEDRDEFIKAFWGSGIRPAVFSAAPRETTIILEGPREMTTAESACLDRLIRKTKGKRL